jgi:uncharacterized protein (TIGR03437 family)
MDFDPSFFGGVSNVAAFSAAGDAAGYAQVKGNHVDAHFSSGSGSIGQLPSLPILAVSVPLVPGLAQSASAALTIDTANSSFSDTIGNSYSISVLPATAQTGGAMSVESISPAGSIVASGGVVQINGTGFDPSTAVAIDGMSIASTQFVSAQQINITLGGSTEMTGKCVRLTNSVGDRLDFFAAMPSASTGGGTNNFIQPLVPLNTYQLVQWTYPIAHPEISQFFALQNQTREPVTTTFLSGNLCPLGVYTIPPGELYFVDYNYARITSGDCSGGGWGISYASYVYAVASSPIRMLAFQYIPQLCLTCTVQEMTFPPIAMSGLPAPNVFFTVAPLIWNYQVGQPPPPPLAIGVDWAGAPSSVVSASVSSSASRWLTAAIQSDTYGRPVVTLTPDVASLGPGTYTGTVTLTITTPLPPYLSEYPQPSSTYPVVLSVSASPFLSFVPPGPGQVTPVWESLEPVYRGPYPVVVPVQSSNDPAPFTATASTSDGGNWLLVTPAKGTTPASITVDVDPAGLAPGDYTGQVKVQGPANSVGFSATYTNFPPMALSFVLEPGSSTPAGAPQILYFSGLLGTVSPPSVQTQSGGNWLTATNLATTNGEIQVSASAADLGPGTYHATITVNGSTGSAQVPVTLTVLAPPPAALTSTPAGLWLTAAAGQTVTQSLTVNSAGGAAIFGLTARIYPIPATGAGVNPLASLTLTPTSAAVASTPSSAGTATGSELNPFPVPVAPATIQVQASAVQPGTYFGSIEIDWDGGSLTVPVTLSVTPTALFPPIMANVVNAASQSSAALVPGEIISIFGVGIGGAPTGFTRDVKGNLPTAINGTEVLINGQPAPLLYVSASQINAIVPYEVGESGTAAVQVLSNGLPSATWEMPVAPAAAGIFTLDGGTGQAAALNQDNSVNGAVNPAAVGTVIQIYGTGGGQTTPASVTGTFSGSSPATTALPVTAIIGNVEAPVTYSGSAPSAVAGLLQVNAIVPPTVNPGTAIRMFIRVSGTQSQDGVTIAVK